MNHSRPKNLNLFTIRFPLPAIISILHRISGFVLVLLVPLMLWTLSFSLTEAGFTSLHNWLDTFFAKCLFWLLLFPLCYHFVAGIRHLLSDFNIGNSRQGGKKMAILTLIISFALIVLAGAWLW